MMIGFSFLDRFKLRFRLLCPHTDNNGRDAMLCMWSLSDWPIIKFSYTLSFDSIQLIAIPYIHTFNHSMITIFLSFATTNNQYCSIFSSNYTKTAAKIGCKSFCFSRRFKFMCKYWDEMKNKQWIEKHTFRRPYIFLNLNFYHSKLYFL